MNKYLFILYKWIYTLDIKLNSFLYDTGYSPNE